MPVDLRIALEARLAELDTEASGIRNLLTQLGAPVRAHHPVMRKHRGMSAAARRQLSLNAKKRWREAKKAGKNKL
jgi:hypothetical protein